jgi:aryl-alcohol dehydrogenase-like predicted oxidoreductase
MAAWEFQALQNIADKYGWHRFISMQNYYNLLYREEEREMIPYCNYAGVGLIPWSPLARGALSRPLSVENTARESSDKVLRSLVRDQQTESDAKIIDAVQTVAQKRGVSMAMVAIAWSLSKNVCPIVGLNSTERIDEALNSVYFAKNGLTEEEINFLELSYVPKESLKV